MSDEALGALKIGGRAGFEDMRAFRFEELRGMEETLSQTVQAHKEIVRRNRGSFWQRLKGKVTNVDTPALSNSRIALGEAVYKQKEFADYASRTRKIYARVEKHWVPKLASTPPPIPLEATQSALRQTQRAVWEGARSGGKGHTGYTSSRNAGGGAR
jgi:hypothetical protein